MSGRIRTIKPEWLEDEDLLRAGSDARVLSVALILLADDYGRGRCIPEALSGQVFPFEQDHSRVFRESLARLSGVEFILLYEVRGQRYFEIRNWTKHQRVDKPGKPRVPPPNEGDYIALRGSREPREEVAATSGDVGESLAPDHDHDHDHDHDPTTREGSGVVSRAPKPGRGVAPSRGLTPAYERTFNSNRLEELFSELRKAAGRSGYRLQRTDYDRAQKAVQWAYDESPDDPEWPCRCGIERYLKHATGLAVEKGYPFWGWANDPGSWLKPAASSSEQPKPLHLQPLPWPPEEPQTGTAR